MLAALFLLGSFPMAFAEEAEAHEHDGCCEGMADGGIVPLWDCDHSYGVEYNEITGEQRGCRQSIDYTEVYCIECGRHIDTINVRYYPDATQPHLGEPYACEISGGYVSGTYIFCDYCHELW